MCRLAGLALLAAVAAGLSVPTQDALAAPEAETELETLRVGRGDSLSLLLHRAGVEAVDIDRISRAIQKRFNLRRLRAGREVRLLFRIEGESRRIPAAVSVQTGSARFVEATRTAKGGYRARHTTVALARPIPLAEIAFERDGITVTVRRNETLGGILYRHGVDGETVDAVVGALETRFDPRGLMPGHAIEIVAGRDASGAPALQGVALHLDDDVAVAVVRTEDGGFAARRTTGAALRAARLAPVSAPEPAPATAPDAVALAESILPPQKPTRADPATPAPVAEEPAAAPPEDEGPSAEAPAAEAAPDPFAQRYTLHAGSTLLDLLLDADVRRPEAVALVQSLRRVFNPRRLPAGITVRLTKRPVPGFEPRIARLEIELPKDRYIRVERGEKGRFSSRIMDEPPPPPPVQPRAVAEAGEAERREQAAAVSAAPSEPERRERAAAASAPAPEPEPLPPSAELVTMRSGDTLMAVLRRHGIDRVEADRAIQAARELINLRRLGIGQEITLVTGTDEKGADTLQTVALRVGKERFVKVSRTVGGHFEASRVDRLALSAAPLQLSAAASMAAKGESGLKGRGRESMNGYGDVMSGAFVAAAAPITPALPAAEARPAETALPVADPGPPEKPVTAHGIVNGTAVAPPEGDDGLLRKAVVIRKGDTLSVALARAGGTRAEAEAAIVAFRKVHNPRHLRIGQTLSLSFDPAKGAEGAPRLASFALDVAPNRDVVVTRGDDGIFLPSVVDRPLDRVLHRTVGAVDSSLYDAVLAAGMPIQTFMEMVHILSFDVDFQREIQPGNRFEALYEAAYDLAGDFVENGPLLYARLEVGNRTIELFRFEPDEGPADYLDARGESVRKALMRTPINGARLSSGYGMRMHPILGYNKKHLGLDFAAPTGTPIFAAGDGTITRIGRAGNYGKYIRIRHNGTYSTGYAHLSGYAKGMKRGKRVRQGQVIGYVGSTGMSTGPHLHYEVMQGNKRINPMTLKLPTGRKLKGAELAAFQRQVQKITILLAEVPAATRLARR